MEGRELDNERENIMTTVIMFEFTLIRGPTMISSSSRY